MPTWKNALGTLPAALLLCGSLLGAQEPPADPRPPYVVLSKALIRTLREELHLTVAQGYRVVAAAAARPTPVLPIFPSTPASPFDTKTSVILERLPTSSPAPEYVLISESNSFNLLEKMNQAGDRGFRVLPISVFTRKSGDSGKNALCGALALTGIVYQNDCTLLADTFVIMERTPSAHASIRCHYQVHEQQLFKKTPMKAGSWFSAQGHDVLAVLDSDSFIGTLTLLEKCAEGAGAGNGPRPARQPADWQVVLMAPTAKDVLRHFPARTTYGHRVINVSTYFGFLLAYERGEEIGEWIEYATLLEKSPAALEKALAKLSAKGFRVLPQTFVATSRKELFVILERRLVPEQRFAYRLLSVQKEGQMEEGLAESHEQGYRVIGLTKFKGMTALLEKGEGPMAP